MFASLLSPSLLLFMFPSVYLLAGSNAGYGWWIAFGAILGWLGYQRYEDTKARAAYNERMQNMLGQLTGGSLETVSAPKIIKPTAPKLDSGDIVVVDLEEYKNRKDPTKH